MSRLQIPEYELLEERSLQDISSEGYILRHKKSGARVCVISNEDDNKVFFVGFRTPPEDETGVPHIIEHTTLCGSERYPVKDPFIELVKGSLNTFLNAMTYPERTLYPVASYNDQDYRNLMAVYMDAVFHPNITKYREIFMQEGWHYELESEEGPLTINGVVYNEMKGAYSSPEEVLSTVIQQTLFPDNTYSKDSGGNPDHIPELTYEAYLDFYHKYYHPSNSYIYLYGDMDIEERLAWMDREYLSRYDRQEVRSEILLQKPFDRIAYREKSYPVMDDEPLENSTYLSYSKAVEAVLNRELYQALDVLDYVLVSAPGAPVKKALIDAGIGEDVYGSYMDGMRQSIFSFVAKNAQREDEERFVSIIEDTLRSLVKNGLDRDALLAAINSAEFRFRESDYGRFPKGLLYGLQCMESWVFDDMQPFLHLECLDTLAFLREQIGTGYFERLLQTYLLDNTHGAVVTVCPERGLNKRNEKALEERLAGQLAAMSTEEKQALIQETQHLHEYQEEPSPEEELRKIPMLTRDDMKREAMPFSNIDEKLGDIAVVRHEIATSGIDYITLLFDAADIPQEDVPYLGLLRSILGYVDTAEHDYTGLANSVNIYTGGISSSLNVYPSVKREGQMAVRFEVKVKVLHSQIREAVGLADEILRTSKLTDHKRLGEIIAQVKSRLQVNLSSSGNSVASMRALSYQSAYAFYQDAASGIAFYRLIRELDEKMRTDAGSVERRLCDLIGKIFTRARLTVSFTGEEQAYREAAPVLEEYLGRLPEGEAVSARAELALTRKNEGLTDASQIQYVARAGDFKKHGFSYTGMLKILKVILNYDYLWTNIRVVGGAYGCGSNFLRTGESYFASYRDPNLARTNEVYNGLPEYIRAFEADERDMAKYIIGTFGALDTPLTPEAKGARSMAALLEELTYEDIQKEREEILAAQPGDIRALAELISAVLSDECLCVIGNENAVKAESAMFGEIRGLL